MEYYNKIAEGYEELYREEQLKKIDVIKRYIASSQQCCPPAQRSLLDVGCGSGISLELWGCSKIGVDTSFELLKQAKNKGLAVVQAKAEYLPFKDKCFDTVISISAAHHFDIQKAFEEIKRVGNKKVIATLPKKSKKLMQIRKEFKKKFGLSKEVMEEKDACLMSF